jgi:hypothetical protein
LDIDVRSPDGKPAFTLILPDSLKTILWELERHQGSKLVDLINRFKATKKTTDREWNHGTE